MKIDHIYCLNLERSKDRRLAMEKQFEHEELDVEFFKACDGKAMGKDGIFGCAQSHINIWKDIVSKGYENVLILEDDVFLEKDFKRYLEVLEPPEKWDILYLGASAPILGKKSEGHFTQCKTMGGFAYILNKNSVLKLAYIEADDLEYDFDMYLLGMPLKTWVCNKTLVKTLFPGISSEIGFRLRGTILAWIHLFEYFHADEIFILVMLVLILFYRIF